jgi:glycosyltransferase involved in cell wall biosynthesis
LLRAHGWDVVDALTVSRDPKQYSTYVRSSFGEFTVAKDQNVRMRTGWFSDRSATYLAAGRPVITQDTGFGSHLPTGNGLFAFTSVDDAAEAVRAVVADPDRHSSGAREVARAHFSAQTVLAELVTAVGV